MVPGMDTDLDACQTTARKSRQAGVHEMRVHQIIVLSPAELKHFPHRHWNLPSPGKANVIAGHALLFEFRCDQGFIRMQE